VNAEARAAQQRLGDVIASTWPVLLDFDGPVTHYFINGRNQRLADQLRAVLAQHNVQVPENVTDTYDPLTVLRWAALNTPEAVSSDVDAASVDGEYQCAKESEPTPGATELLSSCRRVGRPVVIVSNNADGPIRAFLARWQLEHLVDAIVGRAPNRPDLMKPHPHLMQRALKLVQHPAEQCAFVGDSVSDIQVAAATGVKSIGYAKTPRRGDELADAGADALTTHMRDLAAAIQHDAEAVHLRRPTTT